MDILRFTGLKNGKIEPLENESGSQWAFVPDPLPGKFVMTEALWPLIASARDSAARLEKIDGILQDPFLLLRPLQQREAIVSSRLEGTYVMADQILLFDIEQEGAHAMKIPASAHESDLLEVWNHYEALRQGHAWLVSGKPLDQSLILQIHKILMTGVRGKDRSPGEFRKCQVLVGRSLNSYVPPPPEFIQPCMDRLVEFMQSGDVRDPLLKSFLVHYQLEAIHPFEDGNGRVGRVLLSLCVASWMSFTLPWLYMSEYFERHRREYNERLFAISCNSEWAEWIEFCAQGVIEQSKASLARCERLRKLRDEFNQIADTLGPRMRKIIEMLFERPVIIASQISKVCSVSSESARQDLYKLVEAGIVSELDRQRPKAFACLRIIQAAHGD